MKTTSKLGIIGATGWLGQGLGLGLLRNGLWPAEDLILSNRSGPSPVYDAFPGITWASAIADLLGRCGVIVLSLRPEDFPPKGFAPDGQLLISFMAGVPMERLRQLAPKARLVRAMPNGGATTGDSFTPWIAEGLLPGDDSLLRRILSAMGAEARVESEDQLDILTALSGSGPAYPALMAQALLDQALRLGPPRAVAEQAVESVICGSASGLKGRIASAGEVITAMKAYRGVTAAGLDAAEAAGFSGAIAAALSAAVAKARAMGR